MKKVDVLKKFQAKAKALKSAKRTDRFVHVIGKLKRAKLLDAPEFPEYAGPVELEDVLWAGTIEPRILEVLPALMATRPKYLRTYEIPEDLKEVMMGIQTGKITKEFRGIPPKDYCQWLPQGGMRVSQLKTFRMYQEDIYRLRKLRENLGVNSDAEVLRRALSFLEKSTESGPRKRQ